MAEKGFSISVFNRSYDKTEAAVSRAQKEGACRVRVPGPAACVVHAPHAPPPNCPAPLLLLLLPGLGSKLTGYKEVKDFLASLERPR